MLLRLLTNFEIQKYVNHDEYKSVGAHWRALYMNCNNLKYFACFRVK